MGVQLVLTLRKFRSKKYLYLLDMKTKALLLITILSFCLSGSLFAMEEILFNHLGVKDGLSSNEITCILKDQKGFMWFGTTSGLNRFDGYEFSRYKPGDIDSFLLRKVSRIWWRPPMVRFGLLIMMVRSGSMSLQ